MSRGRKNVAAILFATLLTAASAAPAPAASPGVPVDALYRATFVVSGQGERNRMTAFAQCLGDVLAKLTGDPAIVADKRLASLAAEPASFVQTFSYHDRLAGRPIHDEQGTYDRPHDLTVVFDPAKIDALVRALGREPWPPPRPRVVVFLGVENIKATFMLAGDGAVDRSVDMRSAFAAAAEKAGVTVDFPQLAQLETRGFAAKTLPEAALADLGTIARADGGDVAVAGRIVFSDAALGWIASWRLEDRGKVYEWGVRGVNFDAAFRNALFGAAQILSGHGQPQ